MSPRASGAAQLGSATPRLGEILGQERAIGFLRRAWEQSRLAHAYLFYGPAGVGKLATARALAMGLHCEVVPFEACGTCGACRTIAAGTHPDVRMVTGPLAGKRDISIEQVRELQRELGFRSLSGRPKVGIVNDAEALTMPAQNALLKTLEEPAGESLLVLIGVNTARLAATIVSRCQRVAFGPLAAAAVAGVLERHGCSASEAAAVAAHAEGSPGRALTLDSEFFATRRPAILERVARVRGAEFKSLAELAAELASEDDDPALALSVVASWYRDALCRELLGEAAVLQNADCADRLPTRSMRENLRNLETTYATIVALRQNANRNLALVDLVARLAE